MARRFTPLLLLIPLASISPAGAAAHPANTYRATAVGHGIKLALIVPRKVYPVNAVARVTVRVQNISKHTVWLWSRGPANPGVTWPQVDVLDTAGKRFYPPLKMGAPISGPAPTLIALPQGRGFNRTIYLMLGAERLQTWLTLAAHGDMAHPGRTYLLKTPMVRLQLAAGQPPHVTLHTGREGPYADIEPPVGARAKLYFIDSARCGTETIARPQWVSQTRSRLTPACGNPSEWHALAGWLNQPLASVDYVAPGSQPTSRTALPRSTSSVDYWPRRCGSKTKQSCRLH